MVAGPRRDEIWLVSLDPTEGSKIRKTRPCLVVSPGSVNRNLRTVIVAPLTTTVRAYPTRIDLRFQGKAGQVALDQIRAVDRIRLLQKLGVAGPKAAQSAASVLREMFSHG
jgi:mRNA interferase MazF